MDLEEILLSDNITKSIDENLDYLLSIIPELKNIIGFKHKHPEHHLDVWNHTLLALSMSEKRFDIRLCLLLHDIGKPFSYHNRADLLKQWYGPNCLKKWDEVNKEWVEPYPKHKRHTKHVRDLNLNGDCPNKK